METEEKIEILFNRVKEKYNKNSYKKYKFVPKKWHRTVFSNFHKPINSAKDIDNLLDKKCNDKFIVLYASSIARRIGYYNLKIISENEFKRKNLYYLYFKNLKDMLKIKLMGTI